jgi:hypothetical protein
MSEPTRKVRVASAVSGADASGISAHRCAAEGQDPGAVFGDSLGEDVEPERFWDHVEQNLRSGRVRLVFISDLIPAELRRVIEFLNERMSPTEVVGIEIKQYVGQGNLRTLVPRVVGQTEQARAQKVGGSSRPNVEVSWDDYQARLQPDRFSVVRGLADQIENAIKAQGLGWVPRLRSGYLGFQRPGDYHCAGVDIRRERPVDFWIKLPLSPDELRQLGHDIPDLYPGLATRWDAHNKQWRWAVPAPEDIPGCRARNRADQPLPASRRPDADTDCLAGDRVGGPDTGRL